MNLYVGNLSYRLSEDQLRDVFAEFGEVNGREIQGRKLNVNEARPREEGSPRPPRGARDEASWD